MEQALTISLMYNAALLLSLGVIYELCYFIPAKYIKYRPYFSGVLIGLIGICIMTVPFELESGLVFDTRSVLIGATALSFGFIPTTILVIMTCCYRIYMSGIGSVVGIAVITSSALIGLLSRRFIFSKIYHLRWIVVYVTGLIIHIAMLACMFILPYPKSIDTIRQIAFPVLLIYPLGTVLLSMLLIHQQERNIVLIQKAEADAKYKSLFENNHAVMMLIEPTSGQILDVNPAAVHYYGWSRETLKQMNVSQINTLYPEVLKTELQNAANSERNHYLFRHRRADGSIRDVESYTGPIIIDGQKMLYSIIHDVSERVLAEHELQASEQRFRVLVEAAPEAIYIETNDFFVYLNQTAIKLFGAKYANQLIGTSVYDRIHPDYWSITRERVQSLTEGKPYAATAEKAYIKMDGSVIDVESSAVAVSFNQTPSILVFSRDISARKKIEREKNDVEEQLRHKQKMDAIGTLAGGVAHEINNPINGIMNYAQLILDDTDEDSISAVYLKGIISESKRVSEIVRSLLQFSRQEKQNHSYARMDDIINQTVTLIRTIFKKDQIDLQLVIEDNLPEIKCRSQQIQQVLTNLLTNARDALNEKYPQPDDNKIIIVSCQKYENENRTWIRLCVEDHGNGIPSGIREKIFEPFYSTKPKETGTGLGLSISFGIVQDHHGFFTISSELGQYTKFCVNLPVDQRSDTDDLTKREVNIWQE